MGTDGSVIAKVQNETAITYSKIIPRTCEWDSIRTQVFLLSLNISGILSAARVIKCIFQGVTIGFTVQTYRRMRLIPTVKPGDADITSVASIDVPRYRQERGNEKQNRCW